MVSLSAKRSMNLLHLKANVRVKIAPCVLNGSALCLLTKMTNAPVLAPQPCTNSKSGRMFYTYPDGFRSFSGLSRNSQEFLDLYNKRVAVEQIIYHLKSYIGSDTICIYDQYFYFL